MRLRGKEVNSARVVPRDGRESGRTSSVAAPYSEGMVVIMQELLPIVSGLFLGSVLGLLRPSLRVPIGVALIVAFGVLATVVSGEYLISWSFLLIDIPLVAVSAAASLFVTHRLRWARTPR